jgi:DNA-binding NarL/FixJ family response regulator
MMKTQRPFKSAPGKHRVFLVEDHPVTQQGFSMLLNLEADLMVCGRAARADRALKEIESSKPDLVIVDIALPGIDGLTLVKDIATFHPQLPTLVLSTLDEAIYAERALRAGAKGYIMKQEPVELLLLSIRQVLAGDVYLSEAMRSHLFQNSLSSSANKGLLSVDRLSDRELEVFRLIGEGVGTKQIAKQLCLSISTVESHRTHIKEKIGAKRAPDLVRRAVEWLNNQRPRP